MTRNSAPSGFSRPGRRPKESAPIKAVRKRDGRVVPFDQSKIANAIFKAAASVGGEDRLLAEELAGVVSLFLQKQYGDQIPGIEDIQDMVEKVLIETGHAQTGKAYILYRERRRVLRGKLKVRKETAGDRSSTDLSLLVDSPTRDEVLGWDKARIAESLKTEAQIPDEIAWDVASAVEEKVIKSDIKRLSTDLVRALVENELFERGFTQKLEKQTVLGMPKFDIERLIYSKSKENSNITANNPEAINLAIAENTLKKYALQEIFSEDIARAHQSGAIHLHDLGYPTRTYCSSHSLEYIKKYGLKLENLDIASAPAKHARTLTGHLNTFLASMQAYYAGALGVGYINIFYAPYLEGMSDEQILQEAQHLIFSCSQSAFSRGGQTLFLDFNIHTGVPGYLRDIPAIGPGGKYTGKTYAEYEELAMRFTRALLRVWDEGDCRGHLFAFPKCDLHITEETFSDPNQYEVFKIACKMASRNGTPYFIFDRDEVTLSACCRLRTTIDDDYMIKHPESMRFCGFQNITINLPQCAFRAGQGNADKFYDELSDMIDLALQAHLEKRDFIRKLMDGPSMPLWEIGKTAADGRPYVDLDKATYIVGLVGLNECLHYLFGSELHESKQMLRTGLKVISFMHKKLKAAGEKLGLKFTLEESPAESATRRMAKVDIQRFPFARDYVRGSIEDDEFYYTNSIHIRADAPVDLVERIQTQSKFHRMIESGAIIHAFVGEERPPWQSISALVKKTFESTNAAQLTISPEFTICRSCDRTTPQLTRTCSFCSSEDVVGFTRIVGYFSRVDNWNKSKLGELKDRQRGSYKLGGLKLAVDELAQQQSEGAEAPAEQSTG